jgi:uncharacterized membrane protein
MRDFFIILLIILCCSLVILLGFHLLDYVSQGGNNEGFAPFFIFYSIDYESVKNYIGSFAEVITGLFGIIITVVAIIVNLSANRYTSKIIDLFIKDRFNVAVLILFAVICFSGIWVSNSLQLNHQKMFLPRYTVIGYLILISVGVLLIVPYFIYVFHFLKPGNIIAKIEKQAKYYIDKSRNSNGD